jgi:hypothetical protein
MGWDVPGYPRKTPPTLCGAGRRFAVLVRYLRRGDSVFETYWSTGRGFEVMTRWGLSAMTVYGRHRYVARHHSTPLRQLAAEPRSG